VFKVVSKRHAIHQFSEVLVDNVTALLDTGSDDLNIVGAGLLRGGAIGWVQIGTSEEDGITLDGGDKVSSTLTVVSSHDGTFATSYRTGMFRFACSNQLGQVRRAVGAAYKIRHTRNSVMRIVEAREVLGVMFESGKQYAELANGLIRRTCTDEQFADIVAQFAPRPKYVEGKTDEAGYDRALVRWENKRDDLRDYYRSDSVGEYAGTAWGAFQTLNGYNEHLRPFRSVSDGVAVSRAGRTMQRFVMGRTARDDANALELVLANT
jgi:phage/plasmid-like protein (TIGR03299 family)